MRSTLGAAAMLSLMAAASQQAQSTPRHRHCYHCRGWPMEVNPFGIFIAREPFYPEQPSLLPPPGFEPESEPPFVPEASPAPGPAPYPQGFALDVPIKPGDADNSGKPLQPLTRYRDVANALASCWNPPAHFGDRLWRQATLRVSFKRDGNVNGSPRIPYVDQGLTGDARSDLTQSLMGALQRCTPLPFSPGLGAAIAGQVFALRFIEQDQD